MKFQPGKILILVVSIAFSVIIGELFLAIFLPQKTYRSAYKQAINCFEKSETTIFTLKPNCRMNLKVIDSDKDIITKLNSQGYRGSEFKLEKKPGVKRILVEGDSFILGWGVEDDSVISQVLQDKLKGDFEVINAGYAGGMGPDGYYLHIKNEGIKLQPDLVVFSIYVYNDFTDIADNDWIGVGSYGEPKKVYSNKLFVDKNGFLIPKNLPVIYKLPVLKNSHFAVLTYNLYKKISENTKWIYERVKFSIFKPDIPSGEARDSNLLGNYYSACVFGDYCHRRAIHLFEDVLSLIKASRDLVDSQYNDEKSHFAVMIIPADFQIKSKLSEKYKSDTGIPLSAASIADPNPQRRLREMLSYENIKYLDLLPIFRKQKEDLYFPTDGHWNAAGHKLAADALYNWIENNYADFSSN